MKRQRRKETILSEGLEGYTVVSVRLRNAEFLEFSSQVEKTGLKNNRALRIAARRIAGFLELDPTFTKELRDYNRSVGSISRDINQLRKLAESEQIGDIEELRQVCFQLGNEFAQTQMMMQRLLNVSQRRHDGLQLLERASS